MALAETQYGPDEDVTVTVEIQGAPQPGVLSMSVAANAVALAETTGTASIREFTGTLPTVTVKDERDPADIPDDVMWYVIGTASDFVGDAAQPDIPAANLGWEPALINGGASGAVAPGPRVDTALDTGLNNVGLVDEEFLAMTTDYSNVVNPEGEWTANAELFLKTGVTVDPGIYTSTLTLSLFE
jgi:hypothetical protein